MKLLSVSIIVLNILFVATTKTVALDHAPAPKLRKLLQKINHAAAPANKAGKVKNQISHFEATIPMAKITFSNTIILKAPDKMKVIVDMPNIMHEVQVFDGKNGWKQNSRMGFQQLTGATLNFIKYSAIADNKMHFEDKYAKIELAKEKVIVNGRECFKLTCYAPAEYQLKPQTVYVDSQNYLLRKIEFIAVTTMGEVPSVVTLSDYTLIDGLNIAGQVTTEQVGMTIKLKLLSFKINQPIPDSTFTKPQAIQSPPTHLKNAD